MSRVRVNYKSDLPPIEVKFKINGSVVDVPDHDFVIRFFVDGAPGTSFECIHKDDEYINCAKTADDTLTCYIDNHKFGCGRLYCEFIDLSADSRYEDKVLKTVTPSALDVVLVEGAGDSNVEVLNVIFGYEINEIAEITAVESSVDGGNNVVTITQTNGEESSFNVKNGTKGSTGSTGKSAYQSYVDTTTDDPVKTETEWVDSLHGEDGTDGADGQQGPAGKGAYQSYYDTTQDNPKKTEAEWASSLLGGAVIVNDLTTGGEGSALSAEQGKILKGMIDNIGFKVDTKLESFKTPTITPDASQSIATATLDIQQNFGVGKMVTTTKYATLSSFHVVCASANNKASLLPIPSGNKYVFTSFVIRTKGTIGTITASDISYDSNNTFISGGVTQRLTSYEPYEGLEDTYKVYVRYTLSNTAQSQNIKLYQDVTMGLTDLTAVYSGFQSFYFRVWWGNEPDIVWDWNVPFWHNRKVNTIDVTRLNSNNYSSGNGDLLYTTLSIAPQDVQDTFKVRQVCTLNNSVMPTTSTDIKILPCTSQYATGGGKFTLPSWAKFVYASFYIRTKHTLSNIAPNLTHYTTTGTLKADVVEMVIVKVENEPLYEDVSKVTVKWKIAATVDYNLVFFPFVNARLSSVDTTNYNGFQSFYFRLWYSAADEYDFEWDNTIDLNRSYLTTNPFTQTFRKICLYGTSIEATNYFDSVAVAFGLKKGETYLNYGNGGGGITWNPSNASFSDTHVEKAFSCTLAEKQAELTSRGIDPATVPAADLNTSYDVSVLENLDADLFIFGTYGINDRDISGWDSEDSEFDRTTIYGAYNYVIDKLLTAKPNAKIIILGQHCFAWANTNKVNEIQSDVAEHWNIPFLDMGHNLMFNTRTYSLYTSDGCHPNNVGAAVIAEFVKDWLMSHTNNRTK